MADKKPAEKAGKGAADDREARLAAALRENLRRRKSQIRERKPDSEVSESPGRPPARA